MLFLNDSSRRQLYPLHYFYIRCYSVSILLFPNVFQIKS